MNNWNHKIDLIEQTWSESSKYHRVALGLTAAFNGAASFSSRPVIVHWALYPVVIILEGLVLSLQLFSGVQSAMPPQTSTFLIYLITFVLGGGLALFIDVLIITAMPLIKSGLYENLIRRTSSEFNPSGLLAGPNNTLKNNPIMAFSILFTMILGLSIGRGVLVNIQYGFPEWSLSYILISIVTSLILVGLAFVIAPHYLVWKYNRKIIKSFNQATSKRNQSLVRFRSLVLQLVNTPKVSGSLFDPVSSTTNELKVLSLYEELRNDNGSYDCLIPMQRQMIEVTANGEAIAGVKIYGLVGNDKFELTVSDASGKACIEWRSFSPVLDVLSVGPHFIKDFQATVQPLRVEIFGKDFYPPKIDNQ